MMSRLILLRLRNVSDISYRENQETHFVFSNFIYFFENSAVFLDIMEKYCGAGQTTDDNIIRLMRFSCLISKATNTHSEYVILISFPR